MKDFCLCPTAAMNQSMDLDAVRFFKNLDEDGSVCPRWGQHQFANIDVDPGNRIGHFILTGINQIGRDIFYHRTRDIGRHRRL